MKEKKHFRSKKHANRKFEKYFLSFYLLIFLISCGNTNQGKSGNSSISLSLMVKRADIMWYQMQIKGFEDACTNLGVQFLILDNKMDPNLTLTNIDTLISRKIDGVAIAVTEQKMSWIVVNRIFEAGIPVISLNNKLIDRQGRQLAPHIGIDYSEAGISAGKWLELKMLQHSLTSNDEITLGIAELNSAGVKEITKWTNTVQKELLNGIEGLKADIFYRVNSPENDAAGAMLAMQQLISTYPGITNWIIYAGSSDKMSGAILALEQVGMLNYYYTLSIECETDTSDITMSNSERETVIAVNTYEQGKQAAELLFNNIKLGVSIPSETLSLYKLAQ